MLNKVYVMLCYVYLRVTCEPRQKLKFVRNNKTLFQMCYQNTQHHYSITWITFYPSLCNATLSNNYNCLAQHSKLNIWRVYFNISHCKIHSTQFFITTKHRLKVWKCSITGIDIVLDFQLLLTDRKFPSLCRLYR